MRRWALLGVVGLLCWAASAHAERGLPSQARLAEMGLGGIEILSDAEADAIRVKGRPPNPWGNLYPFVYGLSRLDREPPRRPPLFW